MMVSCFLKGLHIQIYSGKSDSFPDLLLLVLQFLKITESTDKSYFVLVV